MDYLQKYLQQCPVGLDAWQPAIFDLSRPPHRTKATSLLKRNKNVVARDTYTEQLRELFAINHPSLIFNPGFESEFQKFLSRQERNKPLWQQGTWVYFPWLQQFVHILSEKDFFKVRTARNKLLITESEQQIFYGAVVGIGGLSIGSSIAVTLALQGGAKHMRLADFDTLALSNTNRIKSGVQNLGLHKIVTTARQIYEINPYAQIELFAEGINSDNIQTFMNGLDIIVDELDNLAVKLMVRMEAKKRRIPLIMGADNADMAVIDVERYDLTPQPVFFHGRLGRTTMGELQTMSKIEIGNTIARLIGLENHTERMIQSLQAIGKTIVSWPQLGGTALLNGAAIAYCIRRILLKEPCKNERIIISLANLCKE